MNKITFFLLTIFALTACVLAAPFVLDPGTSVSATPIPVLINSTNRIVNPENGAFTGGASFTGDLGVEGEATVLQDAIIHGNIHAGAAIYVSPPGFIGTMNGNGNGLTNLQMKISGTNATPPGDGSTIKAWVNVTANGATFKMPLYQ